MNDTYSCGVLNCGNGKCVHELLKKLCPLCGERMIEVTTTGFKFCSNDPAKCDYEIEPDVEESKNENQ